MINPFQTIFSNDQKLVDEIAKDWIYIENRILAELASSMWSKNDYYHVLLNEDQQFLKALESVEKAKLLKD